MRPSSRFFTLAAAEAALLALLFAHAAAERSASGPALAERAALVRELGLTDLCLFTEARYTRHPTQADRHAAFQDSPLSLEHFPSGSLLAPPKGLLSGHADLDR
jgi:hypothetical protein